MKIFTGLDESIGSLTGETEQGVDIPTYRKLLQHVIANTKARTADESRRIARIVPRLRAPAKEIELTDEEYRSLKEIVETNSANLNGWTNGQLLLRMDDLAQK